MLSLPLSIEALNTDEFKQVLQSELAALGMPHLPLQAGLTQGSIALDDDLQVMLLKIDDAQEKIVIRAALFYTSIIAGCSCADDPSPVDKLNEYCEVLIELDRQSANCQITLEDQS